MVEGTLYANKRWGHGRVRQLVLRLVVCKLWGHDWSRWNVDKLFSFRRCRRGCGTTQQRAEE